MTARRVGFRADGKAAKTAGKAKKMLMEACYVLDRFWDGRMRESAALHGRMRFLGESSGKTKRKIKEKSQFKLYAKSGLTGLCHMDIIKATE